MCAVMAGTRDEIAAISELAAASVSEPIDQDAGKVADHYDGSYLRGVLSAAGDVDDWVKADDQRDETGNQSGQSSHFDPGGQRVTQSAASQERQREQDHIGDGVESNGRRSQKLAGFLLTHAH